MNDREFVDALQAIFDADDPADGVDRSDGYGDDYRIGRVRIVPSDDGFDDLEVTVVVGAETVTARLLFDRAWREDSGLDDVQASAAYVVARWQTSAHGLPEVSVVREDVAAADVLWDWLEKSLGAGRAGVNRVGHGTLELVEEDGEVVMLNVTPAQWRSYVARAEAFATNDSGEDAWRPGDGPSIALGQLEDLLGSRWDDEVHIVFFRGSLHQSIRSELPPVRSMLLRDTTDHADGDWYANAPGETDGHP